VATHNAISTCIVTASRNARADGFSRRWGAAKYVLEASCRTLQMGSTPNSVMMLVDVVDHPLLPARLRRYERASLIVTSNKPFGRWGEAFGDPASPPP
jgi:hypothetical protein